MKQQRLLVSWIGHADLLAMAAEVPNGPALLELAKVRGKPVETLGPLKTAVQTGLFDAVHLLSNYPAARPYPSDQIITTYAGHAAAQVCCARALHLHQLDQTAFWSGVTTNCFPTMNIADQIDRLRPFLLHGQRLIAVLPYGLEMERDWFFAFAEQALQRPADYPPPILELHVTWNGNYADMRAQQANHPAVQAFIMAAQQWPTLRGQTLNVYVRQRSYRPSRSADQERFIGRRLFVGEDAYEDSSLPPEVHIRWGLGIDHAAAWNDAQNQSEACFTLLPRALADRQFQHECRNVGPRLAQITFTC